MPTLEEWREKAGEKEYAERLDAKLKEFHHLITKEAAGYLLRLEVEGVRAQVRTLRDAPSAFGPSLLRARVERVFPPKFFERGNSGIAPSSSASPPRTPSQNPLLSCVQRASLSDQSGSGTLVAYDVLANPLQQEILIGDLIEAGPVRFKGGEFHLMPGASLKLISRGGREKLDGDTPPLGHFSAVVSEFIGDFPVRRFKQTQLSAPGGSKPAPEPPPALMTSFYMKDARSTVRVALWDSPGLRGALAPGMEVQIENGLRRGGEIHLNSGSRLVFKPIDEQVSRPAIERIEISADRVEVYAPGKHIVWGDLASACRRLGAGSVPDGVNPLTILELKKKDWVGKPLPARWEEKEN